uniref:Uncharacterized protein n=1 Tax=Peronospora matthiolae TaxID=2874970 RepID=A0AAV1UDU7_9STRA
MTAHEKKRKHRATSNNLLDCFVRLQLVSIGVRERKRTISSASYTSLERFKRLEASATLDKSWLSPAVDEPFSTLC